MHRHHTHVFSRGRWIPAFATVLAFTLPALAVEEPAKEASAAGREAAQRAAAHVEEYAETATALNKAEVKAALAELDAQIETLKSLAEVAPNEAQRESIAIRLDALQERRDALGTDFNRARFDELKADVRREWNEFKAWVHYKTHGDGAVAASDADDRATAEGRSPARDESEAPRELERVALERVDRALERLEEQIGDLPSPQRERARVRLEALAARRAELSARFSDARYTDLMRDILAAPEQAVAAE